MTRARMPRPHEVAAARRDPRLLRAVDERQRRSGLAHARCVPAASIRRRSSRRRASRPTPRSRSAAPATCRGRAWPGRSRSVTATACGAARRRGSGGRCWSPGASTRSGTPSDVERDGPRPAAADRRCSTADRRPSCAERVRSGVRPAPSVGRLTAQDRSRRADRDVVRRRRGAGAMAPTVEPPAADGAGAAASACSCSGTVPAAASTRPTSWRCATPRSRPASPWRGSPSRTGWPAGARPRRPRHLDEAWTAVLEPPRRVDRGRRPAAAAGRRRSVQRRAGRLPHGRRGRRGRGPGAGLPAAPARPAGAVAGRRAAHRRCPRWSSTATGTRSASRPSCPGWTSCVRPGQAPRPAPGRWPARPARFASGYAATRWANWLVPGSAP